MKRDSIRRLAMSTACLLLLAGSASLGSASSFGTLSNFDVVNDTGHECHGFEIELEDLRPSDVPYTFGGTYTRYGTPEVLDTTVDPAHPRVLVRYRHWDGSQWAATPVAPAAITPSGHDCFSGGPIGNYPTSGCEHYGVSLSVNPTRTTYRWLVAASPTNPASVFDVVPETVALPVPVWNVAPAVGGGVDVRAEVEPLEEEHAAQYGEPQWLKVYKVESAEDLQPEDLNRLLLGVAGGIVPDETEIETEWKVIQSKPGNAEDVNEDADVKEDPLDAGKHSVVRRYEFYAYTGPRDPENGEAMPCIEDDTPVPEGAPVEGCADLGDFVGAQNVAVDVDLTVVDDALPAGDVGVVYPDTPLVIGGLPPYVVTVTGGAVPDGLDVDPVTGLLSGTPMQPGAFSFDLHASDAAGAAASGSFDVAVGSDLCPDDPDKDDPGICGCGVPDFDSDGDGVADCLDECPDDPGAVVAGACGCGQPAIDSDGDGTPDCADLCPADPDKTAPGGCGCDVADTDSDGDGAPDCVDACSNDPAKIDPGLCDCGVADTDSDGDSVPDCVDLCASDPGKVAPGACGCGVADEDRNGNGMVDCLEPTRADLAAAVARLGRVKAGKRLKLALRVENLGPDSVPTATIQAMLSGGPFASLKLPKGCTGTPAAIVCDLGKLSKRGGATKTKTISVVPASGASIVVTATVASPLYDPNLSNQSASLAVTVP